MSDLDLDALLSDEPDTRMPSATGTPQYADVPWYRDLLACQACTCRAEASRVVPGEGPVDAQVAILGRNPGKDEDALGRPFVGRAGGELDLWIDQLGWAREKLLVLNLVKCHTTDDRDPRPKEVETCVKKWLHAELETFQHLRVLLTLGGEASRRVLGQRAPGMAKLSLVALYVRLDHWPDRPPLIVVPMAHPAYSLHKPSARVGMRALLAKVRAFLERQAPDAYRSAVP